MTLSPGSNSTFLLVENASVVYPNENGGLLALDGVSMTVGAKEFVCVLGPSGCGKSTLLRLMAGLLQPTVGKLFFEGNVLTGPQRDTGIVFQKSNLMPWRTVYQNVLLPLEISGVDPSVAQKKVRSMLDLVGLADFERVRPRDLSGGMAQRVAIARALVHDPDLLLLDEPFGSLDALTREQMGIELLRIWQAKQKTAVMVTHSISEAILLADRVVVLSPRPGRVRLDLTIDLPRPRSHEMRYTAEYMRLARFLRRAISA